jgi:hypothetical protein
MKVTINFSNKFLYTFIAIGILAIIGVGVYAYGTNNASTFGHDSGELEVSWSDIDSIPPGFADGIDNGLTSVSWTQISNRPSGLDDGDDVGSACGSGMNMVYTYLNGGEDTYTYINRPHYTDCTDTCDGNTYGTYACPASTSRSCTDCRAYSSYFRERHNVVCKRRANVQCLQP